MKTLAAAAAMAIVAGCAAAPAPQNEQATHYWESAKKASESRYRVDNMACQAQTQTEQGSAMFDPNTESFDDYRDCMISRGYVLVLIHDPRAAPAGRRSPARIRLR